MGGPRNLTIDWLVPVFSFGPTYLRFVRLISFLENRLLQSQLERGFHKTNLFARPGGIFMHFFVMKSDPGHGANLSFVSLGKTLAGGALQARRNFLIRIRNLLSPVQRRLVSN